MLSASVKVIGSCVLDIHSFVNGRKPGPTHLMQERAVFRFELDDSVFELLSFCMRFCLFLCGISFQLILILKAKKSQT